MYCEVFLIWGHRGGPVCWELILMMELSDPLDLRSKETFSLLNSMSSQTGRSSRGEKYVVSVVWDCAATCSMLQSDCVAFKNEVYWWSYFPLGMEVRLTTSELWTNWLETDLCVYIINSLRTPVQLLSPLVNPCGRKLQTIVWLYAGMYTHTPGYPLASNWRK